MNKVFVNEADKIGEIVLIGDQNDQTLQEAITESIKFDTEQNRLYGRVATLIDATEAESFSPDVLKISLRGLTVVNYDRLAILNSPKPIKAALEPMLKVIGRSERVQFFIDRGEAVIWLQESASVTE